MIGIEQKIEKLYQETEESVNNIIEGSDEHLDLILFFTSQLDKLSNKSEQLNIALFENLNAYTDEQLQNLVMPKLKQLNKSCMTLIGAFRTSFLYRDVRTSLKKYIRQYDVLIEIIHDINAFRLTKDTEMDELMKTINEM